MVAGPSFISYNGLKYRSDYTQLLDEGSYTLGIVTEKGKPYSGWDVTDYTVTYKYSVIIAEQGAVLPHLIISGGFSSNTRNLPF